MRFICTLLLILLTLAVSGTQAASNETIRYQLTPEWGAAGLESLVVEVSFRGEAGGETVLLLPDSWGGKEELYRAIHDLTISGDGAALRAVASPAERIVTHGPGAALTLRYRIKQIAPGPLKAGTGNPYEPIIQPRFFHLIGHTVWINPSISDESEIDLFFSVEGLPADWGHAASFALEGLPFSGPMKLKHFKQSLLVAGDFRVSKRVSDAGTFTLAARGSWSFSDKELAAVLVRIMTAAREIFGDREESAFLVTLLDLEAPPGRRSLGGTGLHNAFATFATRGTTLEGFHHLLSHECLHHWIPAQLVRMPEEADESRYYWFSEGFTDYYTRIVQLHAGLISFPQLVDLTNGLLDEYQDSSWSTVPNDQVAEAFWKDQAAQRMPYMRGHLFAFHLDAQVRRATEGAKSLRDVMASLWATIEAAPIDKPAMLPDQALIAAVKRVAGIDVSVAIKEHILKAKPLGPSAPWLGPCTETIVRQRFETDYGFDWKESARTKRVMGVLPRSPAAEAGLQNGQAITKMSLWGREGATQARVAVTVKTVNGPREIVYTAIRPTAEAITRFRVKPALTAAELESCSGHWSARAGDQPSSPWKGETLPGN